MGAFLSLDPTNAQKLCRRSAKNAASQKLCRTIHLNLGQATLIVQIEVTGRQ